MAMAMGIQLEKMLVKIATVAPVLWWCSLGSGWVCANSTRLSMPRVTSHVPVAVIAKADRNAKSLTMAAG